MAVLALPLIVSVIVTAFYLESFRRHTRAVDAAGRRLAGMVSRDFVDLMFIQTQGPLAEVLRSAVDPYARERLRAGGEPLADDLVARLAAVVDSLASCACAPTLAIRDVLVVVAGGRHIVSQTRASARWERRLANQPLDELSERLNPLAGTDRDGDPWFAFFSRYPGDDTMIVGLEIDLEAWGPAILDDGLTTLASSFFTRAPLDSAVSVEVRHPDGTVVYRRGRVGAGPTAEVPLFGNELIRTYHQLDPPFTATVTIAPQTLSELIPGGAPRSPVLPIALILAALGFGLAGLRMVNRERALAEARERFLLSIQHEMRTPLAQIRAYGETLQLELPLPQARRRAGNVIVREADRLTALVENALDIARVHPGRRAVRRVPIEVASVVSRLEESVSLLLLQKSIRFRSTGKVTRPLESDPDLLHRLLLTLTENAIRFSPPNSEVQLDMVEHATGVSLRVVDHGPGIPPEERDRLWSPFETVGRGGRPGGTGLGLAIARDLADALGMELAVEDTSGGGATFVIRVST